MIRNKSKNPHARLAIEIRSPEQANVLTLENVCSAVETYAASIPDYPVGSYAGRGIVICGGGRYFASTYILIKMLRQQGCSLPIELWYLGEAEMSAEMQKLVTPFNVVCVDAMEVRKTHPMRLLNGWELKSYAIAYSSFEEVMLLDADNIPVMDPTYLFDLPQYQQFGAIFWPDIYRKPEEHSMGKETWDKIWDALHIKAPLGAPEFESAQLFINKRLAWKPLMLTVWINAHSDFFYQYVFGDKETFNLAWNKLKAPFAMPSMRIQHLRHTLCQKDFSGQRLFQHRCGAKFELNGNIPEEGFLLESDCLLHLAELKDKWDGRICPVPRLDFSSFAPDLLKQAYEELTSTPHQYTRVGYDTRTIEFLKNGMIGDGKNFYEQFWDIRIGAQGIVHLYISSSVKVTCQLVLKPDGTWIGRWRHSGEMPVELRPVGLKND